MVRITQKDIMFFIMFNIICITLQIFSLNTINSKNNFSFVHADDSYYPKYNKTNNFDNDMKYLFDEETPAKLAEKEGLSIPRAGDGNWIQTETEIVNIESSVNENKELQKQDDYKFKVAKTCINMPEETGQCKKCNSPNYNEKSLFYYSPSNNYCDIKNQLANETIYCPYGWIEHINYRNFKMTSPHVFKCSSQKVCCLYD